MGSLMRDVIGWDVANWSHAIRQFERHLPPTLAGMSALELGCGRNGGLSLWLARRGARVICSGYPEVTELARAAHASHGVSQAIVYQRIDARAIPYSASLDIVCFKSVLGGIIRGNHRSIGRHVLSEVYRALKPGGWLLCAENLKATRLHAALRKRFASGRDQWYYFTRDELFEFLSDFTIVEHCTFGVLGALGRTEPQRTVLAQIDRVLAPLLPCSMHYAVAVVAKKPM